jgi:hypothetical protein
MDLVRFFRWPPHQVASLSPCPLPSGSPPPSLSLSCITYSLTHSPTHSFLPMSPPHVHTMQAHRPIETKPGPDGKDVTTVGPFVWSTYAEIQEQIDAIGSAILHFNMVPVNDLGVSAKNIYINGCDDAVIEHTPLPNPHHHKTHTHLHTLSLPLPLPLLFSTSSSVSFPRTAWSG